MDRDGTEARLPLFTSAMTDRRVTYFAFQGLLMAVLLLLFLFEYHGQGTQAIQRITFLTLALGSLLVAVRWVPKNVLADWRFQTFFFILDALLASLTLLWTTPQSPVYLIYFIIIFGTSLTRNFAQSFFITFICAGLYLATAWIPRWGLPEDTGFWLRFLILLISSGLLAILSRDIKNAQEDQEKRFQSRLIHIESLASLGQMAAEVAHRIKGPLTTIMVNAEVLSERFGKVQEIRKELTQIQDEVARCKDILKSLLTLGRIEETDPVVFDLGDAIRSAVASVAPQLKREKLELRVGTLPPLMVHGDRSLLHEAIFAVLQNAVDASKPGALITLGVRMRSRTRWWSAESDCALIEIEDFGSGIPQEHIHRIFQPFFTTKGREGSGLGLSAALRIIQKHHGSIDAYSDGPGFGAKFTLTVPLTTHSRPGTERKRRPAKARK